MNLTPRLTLLLTLPPLLWAGNAVVGRLMVDSVPPLALNALRWGLAVLLLLPFARRLLANPGPLLQRWRYFALAGFLGIGCYNALQYQALHSSSVLNVTLIAASLPVWMLAVGAALYRVRPTRQQLLGAALSLLGVAFVIARGHLSALAQVQFVIGDLLMLLAIFCWSLYSWLLARPPASMQGSARPAWDWAELLMAQLVFGLLFAGSMAGLEQLTPSVQAIHWGPGLALALIYVAVGPSLIAYRCWGLGVAEAGPAMAAFFGNLTPVFAALMSAAMLGEWPQWYHGVAFLLIGAGIVVSAARR
jgi:drug/metabolite transporter (DMT)-like permease